MIKLPQIPGYRVLEKLGQGGMADVYLGIQEKLQRHVAIKVMIPLLFRDEQFSKRFIKEAQTAAQLNHPNIITIHDVGETGDSYFIVMEYLEESLSERLNQRGFLPPRQALEVIRMIACALDYAHKKGFIHRDIKPDNIMFRADGTVVLVDFGIARAMDSTTQLTRTGMSIGTPHYMSPEQCKGEKIDGRSDIYSLGVQFFEIITGKVPYNAENTAGIIIKHIQEPVPRLPDRLSRYQPLLDKMMAKDRGKRFQDAGEVIQFIDGLISTRELVPPPTTTPETLTVTLEEPTIPTSIPSTAGLPTVVQRKKKKWLVPTIAAAAVVILVAVSLYFIMQKPLPVEDKTSPPGPSLLQSTADNQEQPIQAGSETETESKKDTSLLKEEQKPVEKKTAAQEVKPDKNSGPDLKQPGKQEKTEPLKVEKKEVKPLKIETVNLLEVSPKLRDVYNNKLQSIPIIVPVRKARFKAFGQITLDLLIDERGKISISDFKDMLTVTPEGLKGKVLDGIKRRISFISLPPPRDKEGHRVKFNWRITYKVGKLANKIFLTKQ